MSKVLLSKIVIGSETPVPKSILLTDSANVSGRGVVYALVKSHLRAGREVLYLTTALPPGRIQAFFKGEDLAGKVTFHDGYSDPCGWKGDTSSVNLSEPLQNIFNIKTANNGSKYILVIDKLEDVCNHQDSLQLIRNLHKVGTDENVEQLVLYCGRDCVPETTLSALSHMSSASVHILPASPYQCKIVLQKPSGKVLQSHEEFTLTTALKVQDNKIVEKTRISPEENSDADILLASQTTFNLSLTEDQRRSKNMLLLPHTRVQSSGGQIHYTPDDVDDWDEEDPDDDLDI